MIYSSYYTMFLPLCTGKVLVRYILKWDARSSFIFELPKGYNGIPFKKLHRGVVVILNPENNYFL